MTLIAYIDEPVDPDAVQAEDDVYPDQDTYDQYIIAQVSLPRGDNLEKGTIMHHKHDHEGNLIGNAHHNPTLDMQVYELEFSNGHVAEFSTNVKAENIYALVDNEGREMTLFKSILDHRCDATKVTPKQEVWIVSSNGNHIPWHTMRSWDLCVKWSDSTTSWKPVKDLKDSNGIEVAEYAVLHNLSEDPASSWWVWDIVKRQNRFIAVSHTC